MLTDYLVTKLWYNHQKLYAWQHETYKLRNQINYVLKHLQFQINNTEMFILGYMMLIKHSIYYEMHTYGNQVILKCNIIFIEVLNVNWIIINYSIYK